MRNDFSSNYLSHHGILGMKWGIRKYQNPDGSLTEAGRKRYGIGPEKKLDDISSAKGIQRRLNDVDKAIARNKRKAHEELTKSISYSRKANKIEKKLNKNNPMYGRVNITNPKLDKYKRKANESLTKANQAEKMIVDGDKQINRLIDKAYKSGYSMTSKKVMRDVSNGREVISSLVSSTVMSAIFGPTIGVVGANAVYKRVEGTSYKVKNKK